MPLPREIVRTTYCLDRVSKNIDGQAVTANADYRTCGTPPCETLTTVVRLELAPTAGPCDGPLSAALDGVLSLRLVTAFMLPTERSRGLHSADLDWRPTSGGSLVGSSSGVTNAGTLRPPHFPECEDCEQLGAAA